jgi:hypothetical protein
VYYWQVTVLEYTVEKTCFFNSCCSLSSIGHQWNVLRFTSVSWSFRQSVGLLGRVISPSQGLYLNAGQHKHRINTLNIHTRSGIRIHDHSFRTSEDSSCLR